MEIREAAVQDQDNIIQFIKDFWDENHIFVKSPDLFRYQYQSGDQIHFVLGIDNNELVSILGYIPYSNEKDYVDIFLAMWMTSPNMKTGNIGLLLNKYLLDKGYRSVSCCGIANRVKGLYKFLGYTTGTLEHYYMLNNDRKDFTIPEINHPVERKLHPDKGSDLLRITNFNELKEKFNFDLYKKRYFYKDQDYIKKRYFEHPFYQYQIFGVDKEGAITSLLITREISINGSKLLRVIDFIGEEQDLGAIGHELQKIMNTYEYEYIDFYQYGISEDILNASGFVKRDKKDSNIIPNYFEPFEKKNVDIHFATNITEHKYYIFKGDGDQDRPNLLPGEMNQ